jgi:beta-galactosidase
MGKHMQNLFEEQFLFGASCAPYAKSMDWPEAEWDSDFATMRKLNFNTIRIFAAWDRIEREEGVFDYSKQDFALELAAKHGLKVVLNFGGVFAHICGIYPPEYMQRNPECLPRQSSAAAPAHAWAPGSGICSDTPIYRRKAFEFMERTVRRYAECDALWAWMTWNEPASYVCYCKHTQEKFQKWLKDKYKDDLDELSRLWGTEYPVRFRNWAEVVAPSGAGVLNSWRDWLQFNQFRLYDNMEKINVIVRGNDPRQRPTTSNIVYHLAAMEGPVNAPQYGMDLGRVGQSMSLMGLSFYTVEHKYDIGTGALSAYKLSRIRSVSAEEKRRMIVLESGAGPNLAMATRAQHMVNFHQLLAHNVKGILLWNYRSRLSDGQVALFNLMKWDGTVSRRAQYMSEFSKTLQDNARLLNDVVPERQAAILTLEDQQILMDGLCGAHRPATYSDEHDSRVGAYKLLWDMHVPTDCLTECQLSELDLYHLLLLPMQEHMSSELAEKIRNYVAAGGTVIAESPFAFRSTDNILQYTAPGFGLDEVFGCQTHDREGRETAPEVICQEGKAEVCLFWSEYCLKGGTAVATYGNGEAAAVVHDFGKGRAVIFGTEVFRQYLQNPQSAFTSLMRKEIMASGIKPVAQVTGNAENVEISRLAGDEGVLYIFINHSREERRFCAKLRDKDARWLKMGSKRIVDMDSEIVLAGQEVLALTAEKI